MMVSNEVEGLWEVMKWREWEVMKWRDCGK